MLSLADCFRYLVLLPEGVSVLLQEVYSMFIVAMCDGLRVLAAVLNVLIIFPCEMWFIWPFLFIRKGKDENDIKSSACHLST